MNILKVIAGLLLPVILAAQRPLLPGAFEALRGLIKGSTTLSGYGHIVFKIRADDAARRWKLSMGLQPARSGFHSHGA